MSLRLDHLQVCQSCKLTHRLDLTVFSTSDPLSAYTSHIRVFAAVVSRQSIGWHMSARTLPADYERTTSTPVVVRNSSPKVNDWGSVRLMTD